MVNKPSKMPGRGQNIFFFNTVKYYLFKTQNLEAVLKRGVIREVISLSAEFTSKLTPYRYWQKTTFCPKWFWGLCPKNKTNNLTRRDQKEYTSWKSEYLLFSSLKLGANGASLVVQWLRIHLPIAGDTGAIPGPGRFHLPWGSWTRAPQLLKPTCLEPMLHKRNHRKEKPTHRYEEWPRSLQPEKALTQQQRPSTAKNK